MTSRLRWGILMLVLGCIVVFCAPFIPFYTYPLLIVGVIAVAVGGMEIGRSLL